MLLFFLIGIDRTHSDAGCTICSLLIQYFTMASVAWMGAEAVVMFQKLIIVFGNVTKKHIIIASVVAWCKSTFTYMYIHKQKFYILNTVPITYIYHSYSCTIHITGPINIGKWKKPSHISGQLVRLEHFL